MVQGAALSPRVISSELEEGRRGEMGPDGDWTSVDLSLASKSVDPSFALNSVDLSLASKSVDSSLILKTVDGRLPSKTRMEISKNSDLNNKTALRVQGAEAGYGRNKVLHTYQVAISAFSCVNYSR